MQLLRRLVGWWAAQRVSLRWGAVVAEAAMLWWTSSRPMDFLGHGVAASLLHNSAHPLVYGLMGALALLAGAGQARPRWTHAVGGLLVAAAYGGIDEWHQSFVPGRDCSLWDWAADATGAACAVCGLAALATSDRRWLAPGGAAAVCALAAVLGATFAG